MKKKLIISFLAVILLVSLLPYPQNIERMYRGVNTENGESVDISLDMTYLRFLFLENKMSGTITVKTDNETFVYGEHVNYAGQSRSENNVGDYSHDFGGWYFNETMRMKENEDGTVSQMPAGFEGLSVHISSDFDKILIFHNTTFRTAKGEVKTGTGGRYIGSLEESGLEEAKRYFVGYYD